MHFKTCVEMQCYADAKRVHKAALHLKNSLKKQSKKSGIALLFHSAKGRRNGFPNQSYNPRQRISIGEESPFEGDLATSPQQRFDITRT